LATTVLQAVNRIRRLHRFPAVAEILSTDSFTNAIVDALQVSTRDLLETADWDFLRRHDGILRTRQTLTVTSAAAVSNGSTLLVIPAAQASLTQITGNWVTRVRFTEDEDYGNTAFRIVSAVSSGSNVNCTLELEFPGTTDLTASLALYRYEYGLSQSNVQRSVLAMKCEETPVAIEQVSGSDWFDQRFPRPWENTSDTPEIAAIGGTIVPTYNGASAAPDPQPRIAVYPCPDAGTVLQYSYKLRFAADSIADVTDEFEAVPDSVLDCIVDYAYGYTLFGGVGYDPESGDAWMKKAKERARMLRTGVEAGQGRRRILQPIEYRSPGRLSDGFGRLPRIHEES
jgi:hypothetical protein